MKEVRSTAGVFWRLAQVSGVAATVLLLVGLITWGPASLTLLWSLVIPLVPASLLIAPQLWRNVCPLATINMASNGWWGRRAPSQRMLSAAGGLGVLLLWLMVPARRFLFNSDGFALAITIAAVAVLALALGAAFDAKSGFCNALCPVLPVERLYGQRPFVEFSNPRCESCGHCSVKGCIDLAPTKSIAPVVGSTHGERAWWRSVFGVFAAAFPGFVLGYYLTPDGPLTSAPAVYVRMLTWMSASYLITVLVAQAFHVSATRAMPVLAATAAALYYWFASPVIADAVSSPGVTVGLRAAFLALVGLWFLRAAVAPVRIVARG